MSQSGIRTLFGQIFDEKPAEKLRKGRSIEHIEQRNDCLIDRYFFYGRYSGLRYSKILDELSKEFFLSTITIPEVIDANFEKLHKLKQLQPQKNYFVKKWPHLVWAA